jgi:ubiquinone/menaquinone biosynthesis C-methylase UbiE
MTKFDAQAATYDASRGGVGRGAHFAKELTAYLPRAAVRILELGVGTAAVARPLTQRGYQVLGVDISASMLAQGMARLPGRLCLADGAALPFQDAVFDASYACWVMNHLADPSSALAEITRVLRLGGRFLVMDRNMVDSGVDPYAVLTRAIDRRLVRSSRLLQPRSGWFAELAETHGLRNLGVMQTNPWIEPRSLRQAIEHARSHVFGRHETDEEWEAIEPVLDELGQRPDADDVVLFHQGHEVLVLERAS